MFSIANLSKKLLQKMQKKAYRNAYVAEHVRRGIAYQIRTLRDQRGWNQGKLSTLLGKPQSVVSRLEDPNYGKLTLQSLLEIAKAFDVALVVKFVSHSAFLQQTRDVSNSALEVPSFQDDFAMKPSFSATHLVGINVSANSEGIAGVSTGFAVQAGAETINLEAFSTSIITTASGPQYVH